MAVNRIKLMLVDDHDMIREGLVTMLSECNEINIIGSCSESEEAKEMALERKPDLILMDIKMPGTNGIDTARQIMEQTHSIKIIFLTVFEDTESIQQALQIGAAGYLLKHITRDKLIETIRRVYSGETIIDPAVMHRIVNDYTRLTQISIPNEQSDDSPSKVVYLTPREQEIMSYLAKGLTNKEISASTHLAVDTVKSHLRNIFRKLGVKNRAQAIAEGHKLNLSDNHANKS